jgi:tetratricopeptide (TPR) repeat protein
MSRGQTLFSSGDFAKASIEFRNALQVRPKDPTARVMAGRAAEKLGRVRDAAGLYQSVLEDTPDNVEARANLGRLMIFGGVPERGLKVIEPALAKHPDDARLLTLRAAARVRLKDRAGAVADADRALQLAPRDEQAVQLRAGLYKEAGQYPQAIALLTEALRHLPDSTDLHTVLADVYSASGDDEKAEAQLRSLIDLRPKDLPYRYQLAQFYVRTKRIDEAQRVLEQAVTAFPQNDGAKLTLVDFVSTQRSAAQGQELLRHYVAADPDNHDLRLNLGTMLALSGATKEAADAFSEVIRRDGTGPKGLRARQHLAEVATAEGRYDEAHKLIAQILDKNPRDNDALTLRGRIALLQGDPTAAVADFRAVARDNPRSAAVQRWLAQAYEANGDLALAEQSLRAAMAADPSVRTELADLLTRTGHAPEAVQLLEEAVRNAPSDVATRELLIRAYLMKPDLEAAHHAVEDLKVLRPGDPANAYLAALVLERQGRLDAAQREYEQALAAHPQAFALLEALSALQVGRGQVPQAIARVREAIARDPKDARPVNLLGGLYLAQKNYRLATETLTHATELAPRWSVPYRNLGLTRLAADDVPGAVSAYQTAIRLAPVDPKLVTELADILASRGRADEAIALYEDAHKRNPNAQLIARNLALTLVTYHNDRASLERARQLTAGFASSNDGRLLDTNGWVQVKRGEYREALPVLVRAVERSPDSMEIRYHLGIAEMRAGESARARQDLEMAVSRSQKTQWTDDARLALASLNTQSG